MYSIIHLAITFYGINNINLTGLAPHLERPIELFQQLKLFFDKWMDPKCHPVTFILSWIHGIKLLAHLAWCII